MDLQMKRIRESRGLSQQEVADLIGVPVRRYGSWERGERNMNLDDAVEIAQVLNCTLDELAGRKCPSPAKYSDPRQQSLNYSYSMLDDKSKDDLTGIASTFTADASRLAVKSGQGTGDEAEAVRRAV